MNEHIVAVTNIRDKDKKRLLNIFTISDNGMEWESLRPIKDIDSISGAIEKLESGKAIFPIFEGGFLLVDINQPEKIKKLVPIQLINEDSNKSYIYTDIHFYDRTKYIAARAPECNACKPIIEFGFVKVSSR